MSNSLSASFPEYFSRRMQVKRTRENIYPIIANYEEVAGLKDGDRVHRPYRSALVVQSVGTDGAVTRQDITDTDEYLDVTTKKDITIYVEDYDAIQSHYKTANEYADDAGKALYNWIDGDVLGEYANAASVVGNYELAGSGSLADGIGFTLTTSNILSVFGKARRKLDGKKISQKGRWAAISPEFYDILWQFIAGKESALGDTTGQNGHVGKYGGFELYVTPGLGWSSRLEFATNPTDGDTVVINGVTLTFKDTLGTTAGNLNIASTAALTLATLVAAINTPGTSVTEATDAGFVALSAANQALLSGITATDVTTYMTLKGEGVGYVAVSETLSATDDIWTTTKQIQHVLFGQGKPVDLIIQKYPKVEPKDRSDASYAYIGKDILLWLLYGLKTFTEGKDQLVDVLVRSDGY